MSVVNTVNNFAALQYQGVMQSTGAQSDAFSKSAASVGLAPEATKAATIEYKPSTVDQTSLPARIAVEKAAQAIQDFVQSTGRNLNFSVDPSSGYHVIRVTNSETGELVRQMPSPELLKISQNLPAGKSGLVSQSAWFLLASFIAVPQSFILMQ